MVIAEYMDVTLREFKEVDVPLKVEWINNPANNKYLHYELPARVDKTVKWFREKDNSKRIDCVIEYDGTPVGVIGLLQIDRINSKAEYYITVGENSFKNKGIATKATKAIINYAFEVLKLHKIYLTVDSRNKVAIKLYEKSGFKQEGYVVDDLYCSRKEEFIDRERYALVQNRGGVRLYFEILRRTSWNTPIQKLNHSDENNRIYVKREDLIPISFGGNKARKAGYFFREIADGGYDSVVTYGSSSSNHCRIVSNMAASRGLSCVIIGPQESSESTFNSKMMELFGAEIIVVPVEQVHETIENKLAEMESFGRKPYFIPGGGHGNLGTQAYVDCYEEIIEYEKVNQVYFEYIFFASGTGTTQAGLVCGQLLNGDDRQIVGISIARKNPRGRQVVLDSVKDYCLEKDMIVSAEQIEKATVFVDDYIGAGYGKYDSDIKAEIRKVLINYGIPLDTTYTGKAYTGMKKYIEENNITGKNVLFIHTGGTPLFFDDLQ